jgi:hypothetical protein
MRIPAEPNRDPDLVFSTLIQRFQDLLAQSPKAEIGNPKNSAEKTQPDGETNKDMFQFSKDFLGICISEYFKNNESLSINKRVGITDFCDFVVQKQNHVS